MGHETHPDAPQRAAEHNIGGYVQHGIAVRYARRGPARQYVMQVGVNNRLIT